MKITIAGVGISVREHLTLGAMAKLRSASHVMSLCEDTDVLREVIGREFDDLSHLYRDGVQDEENYLRVLDAVLEAASLHGDAALAIGGHPRVGVTLTAWLQDRSGRTGDFELETCAGISSFATMSDDLGHDPLARGSVMLDANRLLLYDLELTPELDHYIYHVCSVGTARIHRDRPAKENRLDLLRNKLLTRFGTEHPVTLIGSADDGMDRPTRVASLVGRLTELLPHLSFSSSLFVPGALPTRVDHDYLASLMSPEELEEVFARRREAVRTAPLPG